jgi:hypothetical protein
MFDTDLVEAYQPPVSDGRSRFPEDLKAKAPKGMQAAIAAAAQIRHTTNAEYVRQAVLQCLATDGVRLRRGLVEITSQLA